MVADSLHLYPGPTDIYNFVAASFMLGFVHLLLSSAEMGLHTRLSFPIECGL